jgi:uncharacterized caspase-like protein
MPPSSDALVFRSTNSVGSRVAFALGNASYGDAGALKNPTNDAVAVAKRLVVLGSRYLRTLFIQAAKVLLGCFSG